MKVRFKPGHSKYLDLTPGNVYRVIGIEADHYRIMNDDGRPYLYPPKAFHVVDSKEPRQWRTWHGEDGEKYSYPADLREAGFFEDYFDGNRKAMATLHRYLGTLRHSSRPTNRRAAS
jgi:hypothetical protein